MIVRIKKIISNIFATTGITLVVLSLTALMLGGSCLFLETVFQVLGANTIMHLGLLLIEKFEFKFIWIEAMLGVGVILIVAIIFGYIFNWVSSTPLWILIIMSIAIYFISAWIKIIRVNKEIYTINSLLKKRNQTKEVR